MPIEFNKAACGVEDPELTRKWGDLRPEIKIPGYWNTLSENCGQWAEYTSVSPLWKEFEKRRQAWTNEFFGKTGGALLASSELPKFIGKGSDRIQTKIAQRTSGDHPAEDIKMYWPPGGPPVPGLNDLVRTRVECAFLDGVEFVGTKLKHLADEMGIPARRDREGSLEGYFAQHFYFKHEVFFRFGGHADPVTIDCEVQLATQLATRIWEQSHPVYEQWRGRKDMRADWQWNPRDQRFIARQLGHMIHLADGLLVQLRDARSSERT